MNQNATWQVPDKKCTYILRYFLPYPPYVSRVTEKLRLEELVQFCKKSSVEAVQLYCNTLDDWYYMPDTLEHALVRAEEMKRAAQVLRDAGISYQLNLQCLMGHHTGHTDMRGLFGWENLVDHRGVEIKGCACPLGERFHETAGKQLEAWASTCPDVLWLDDDLRLHNHQDGSYRDFYCYCPVHMEKFSRQIGKAYTREKLLAELLSPGKPGQVRAEWLDFLNETMADTVSWIEKLVHGVSPDTRIAQMFSISDVHAAEGRNWEDYLTRLTGHGHTPIVRPHFGPYTESSPVDFINSYSILDQSMKNIRMQYHGKVDFCPELENTRFTAWAKSAAATRFQLILGQLLGCTGITLSLYDLEGSPLSEEPDYGLLLEQEKPVLDRLAQLGLDDWVQRGLGFVTSPELGKRVHVDEIKNTSVPAKEISALLGPGRTWDKTLLQMGVPTHYISPKEACLQEVVALDGTTVCLLEKEEIDELMSGGVLLDSYAAKILIEKGYSGDIGLEAVEGPMEYDTSAELFHGSVLEGLPEARMPLRLHRNQWHKIKPVVGAVVLTEIVDPGGGRFPGTVLYENAKGGRIAVYAGCIDLGVEFYNHQRVRWLNALLLWLGKGKFPLITFVERRMLSIRRDTPGYIFLAYANLSADRIDNINGEIRDAGLINSLGYLSKTGQWCELDMSSLTFKSSGRYEFKIDAGLQIYDWLILRFGRSGSEGEINA